MSNCLFAYPDLTLTATLSGGSWSTGLPLNNLKNPALATVARTVDDAEASTVIKIDLGSAKLVDVIALINHNISDNAALVVVGSNNSDLTSPIYITYPAVTVPAALTGYQKQLVIAPAATARYWGISIFDTNNPAGYVQMGRCFIGTGFRPALNMAFGAGITPITATTSQQAIGGTTYFNELGQRRSWRFTLDALTEAEGVTALDLMMDRGLSGELFFLFDGADTAANMMRRSFLANLRQLSALEYPYVNRTSMAMELLEVL